MSDVMIIQNSGHDHFTVINQCFQKNFSDITNDSDNHVIMRCLNQFKEELLNKDVISYEIEDDEITHSDKVQFDLKLYHQYPQDLARFVSSQFGTAHAFVCNRESFDGIIFVGQQNNIYATRLVFEYFEKIASNIYTDYFQKLKRYKKQETKEDKARDHMEDWLDDLKYFACEARFFEVSDEELFGPYAKQHFKTTGQEHKAWHNVAKLLEPIIKNMKEDSISFGELRDRINKHHPEDMVNKVMQEANDLNEKDLILSFNKNYFDDDDEFFGDEEE